MPKKHITSRPSDVKIHDLKSVVSPVNLLYKVSVGTGRRHKAEAEVSIRPGIWRCCGFP